jgi:transposase
MPWKALTSRTIVSRCCNGEPSSYLPKYPPDLNPIEQFFAKLKHRLRKAEQRTTGAVFNAIGPILDAFRRSSAPIISTTQDMTKPNPIPL